MKRFFRGNELRSSTVKKCAWVTLVMMKDSYIPGALVLAESLREVKTKHSIVCMVTDDVSIEGKRKLSMVFDEVILVDYITNKTKKYESFKQDDRYSAWINNSFTKWSCLRFIQYDKVIFIDADMITITNCDELFELKSPAACYAWIWTIPWKKTLGNIKNFYCPKEELTHGAVVHKELIIHSIKNDGYVGWGTMLSLEPDIEDFKNFVSYIKENEVYGEDHKCMNGADEQSIALYYAERKQLNWTNVHQQFLAVPWIPQWQGGKEMRAMHYLARKPWDMHPEEFPDIQVWWKLAEQLSYNIPELKFTFYTDGKDLTDNDIHLNEYLLITDIRDKIISSIKKIIKNSVKKYYYDIVHNALSRLMISLNSLECSDGLIDEILNEMDSKKYTKWTTIFKELKNDNYVTSVFIEDIKEIKLFPKNYNFRELINIINSIIKMRLEIFPRHRDSKIEYKDNTLSCGSTFKITVSPVVQKLIDMKGTELTMSVILKYRPLYEEYQCCLTQRHVDNLYDNFGVINEAFASPLNSLLIGKENTKFYSLHNVDREFGSKGNFFSNNPFDSNGNWIINPPNDLLIIDKLTNLIMKEMDKEITRTLFIILPNTYSEHINKLIHHRTFVTNILIVKNRYIFRNFDNETITSLIDYRYIVLSNQIFTSSDINPALSIF